MKNLITWDTSLKVGDFVFSTYHKGELLFKITKIERRFLTKDDLRYAHWPQAAYHGCSEGDEYNPYVTIESVANLSINNKKYRKTVKGLDGSYLVRVDPQTIQNHVAMLQKMLTDLWP